MSHPIFTRRTFLKSIAASAIAIPTMVPSSALGLAGTVRPGNRITIAVIGTGNMGGIGSWAHSFALARMRDAQVIALCDVKRDRCEQAKRGVDEAYGNSDCRIYRDYRDALARNDLDAVLIATPENWHALITTEAARAGKHVYCEKPLTRTFEESRVLREVVKRSGIVFQHGTQHRSDRAIGYGCELVRSGRIGRLKNVKLVIPSGSPMDPQPAEPVPEDLDYDLWLGPAPWAPYNTRRYAGGWYSISDYCMGRLAGWGAHHVDTAQQGSGTDQTGPVEIDGTAEFPDSGLFDTPLRWNLRCRFANGLTWQVTDTEQDAEFCRKYRSPDGGVLFEGEKGSVFVWRDNRLKVDPPALMDEPLRPHEDYRPGPGNHRQNFLDCIRSGRQTTAPVDTAVRSYTINCLLEIAARLGRRIQWDPDKEQIVGDSQASRMLTRTYRAPWRLQA